MRLTHASSEDKLPPEIRNRRSSLMAIKKRLRGRTYDPNDVMERRISLHGKVLYAHRESVIYIFKFKLNITGTGKQIWFRQIELF